MAVSNAVAAVCALLRANAAAAPGQIAPCAPALLTTASAEDATHLAERAASSRPGMRPLRPQSALNSSSSAAWPAVADGRHTVEKDLRRNSTRESQRARPLKLGKCFTHLSEGLETSARHAWVDAYGSSGLTCTTRQWAESAFIMRPPVHAGARTDQDETKTRRPYLTS